MSVRRTAAVLLASAALSGCSPVYVLRAGYEEAKILSRRQSIRTLVADPGTPERKRQKLALVLQARTYADRHLQLRTGESYTTFSEIETDTLALVLSAARRDRFTAHRWWFPIVGHVPYKGFFSEAAARREMERLESRGFDTYLRPTAAFSTLGWFNDPVLSSVLRADDVDIVNTVIHELFHNTIYLAGEAAFNESLANFVGARGAIDFFCAREGEDSAQCRTARAAWRDDLRFGAFLSGLVRQLEALYARADLPLERKLAARDTLFASAKRRFRDEVRPALEVQTFTSFERNPLNNATLISRRLYYDRLELFESAYLAHGRDLPRTIRAIVAAARDADDPYAAVARLSPPT